MIACTAEAPFRTLRIFPVDWPDDVLILCSFLSKAINLLTTIRGLLRLNPIRIAIPGPRFAERQKKAFGVPLEVRFEEMGSDEHVDSTMESAIFEWLFFGRLGKVNCTLVRGKRIESVQCRPDI